MTLEVCFSHFATCGFDLNQSILLGEFDMRVKSCAASDGAGHVIKLSDEFGCVLRPKMISKFLKARAPDERATVITYAFFHAFKFPDALSVHIKCKVEICRHGCLDHCQTTGTPGNIGNSLLGGSSHEGLLDRQDTLVGPSENERQDNLLSDSDDDEDDEHEHNHSEDRDIFYDDIIHKTNDRYAHDKRKNLQPAPVHQHDVESDMEDIESLFLKNNKTAMPEMLKKPTSGPQQQRQGLPSSPATPQQQQQQQQQPQSQQQQQKQPQQQQQKQQNPQSKIVDDDKFPHGPRQLQYAQNRAGLPVAGPRALNLEEVEKEQQHHQTTYRKRTKRSVTVTDRKARSADVGVSGIYDVISEADLQFSPDTKQEAVTVFQGKIAEEVVYGICMPVQGFSILFILVISATIIAALVAGSLLYRYQLQKDALVHQQANVSHMHTLANWMTMRLFRMKHPPMSDPGEHSNIAAAAAAVAGSPRQMESRQ